MSKDRATNLEPLFFTFETIKSLTISISYPLFVYNLRKISFSNFAKDNAMRLLFVKLGARPGQFDLSRIRVSGLEELLLTACLRVHLEIAISLR